MWSRVSAAVVGAVLVVGLFGAPAEAAAKPSKVGLITFTGASLSGTKASLSLRWPAARNARSYELFLSTSYSGVMKAKVHKRTSKTSITLTGLKRGATYFVTVRGVNGSKKGTRASRVGRTTIASQGSGARASRSVTTWNLCTEKSGCTSGGGAWSRRQAAFQAFVKARKPSVLALQESKVLASGRPTAVPGYTRAAYYSSKSLFLNPAIYGVVTKGDTTREQLDGTVRECREADDGRYGCLDLGGGKYAVWAEVEDLATGQHVIYVSVHLTSGKGDREATVRRTETTRLVDAVRQINPEGLQVVLAGDWNSHRNRSNDWQASVLRSAGYRDAYDLARSVGRQHHNSYNDWKTTPTTSVTWGDHVDKVWVVPGRTVVTRWENAAPMSGSRYAAPLVSDHNPVLVRLSLD
ncbi:endonuclease/exonuclease/phosphatase family protein [Aeromicrobium sp. 50.2.37]|uniref:endonuclease/exonuclease/phosphatase family protein n=1 Tax=Aeromicrobium sp. 50.2.37 TaxID=2969305 RepID=UPI00214FA899|nr:endonuclease/exonuclease/phosphatase family protein [Aeromicrobium sp. 50.2.37]MCR4514606.1 endonuclease/exonuclease/phosphatase family protein [Aeromicrobium sp. 50.2.37]